MKERLDEIKTVKEAKKGGTEGKAFFQADG